MKQQIITAVDVGTTKICVIIAAQSDDRKLEVKGIGLVPAVGLEKGIIKDIQAAADSINKAIEEAEKQAGIQIDSIHLGIAGEHVRCINATGRISVAGFTENEPSEITEEHVAQVINDAKNSIKIQKGLERLEIIHALPQTYDIDNDDGIQNPLNMSGFHLTAHVNVIMADVNAIRNLTKCIELTGYEIKGMILEPLASSMAVLTEDEKKLGCIMIDIGGGTSDLVVYDKGTIAYTQVIPLGGENVTRDLAIGLRTNPAFAESLKVEKGNAMAALADENSDIVIEGISGRPSTSRKLNYIAHIIEHRMEEILTACYQIAINNYAADRLTAGVVITGGSSLLINLETLAAQVFNMPVKVGYPDLSHLSGPISRLQNPVYATAIGLLYYALDQDKFAKVNTGRSSLSNKGSNLTQSIKNWWNNILDSF